MKRSTALLILASIFLLGMASSDFRENSHPVGKICIDAQSWVSGETAAATDSLSFYGKCSQIEFDCAENTTNNITFTVAVTTSDAGTLFTKAALADNGSTILKATSDATDFDAFLVAEAVTVTVTPSGDPGATGATVNVGFYVE